MNIDEVHDFINFITSKERKGFISPEEKDSALYSASLQLFNDRLPFYAVDEKAQGDLAPFKKSYIFTAINSITGKINLPIDFIHLLSIDVISYDNDREQPDRSGVPMLNDDELARRLKSQLDPVTKEKPICKYIGRNSANQTIIQLFPKVPNTGEIWYLKKPNKPKYAYTQDSENARKITYDPTTSVHLEWNELNVFQVINRALPILGIHLDADKLIQYGLTQNQVNP